jgi:iron complex outermembrane receptor protein
MAVVILLLFARATPGQVPVEPDTTAEARGASDDSLLTFSLGEIVVGASPALRVDPVAVQRIPLVGVRRQDAASLSGIAASIPSAHVQTNSRGESLVSLRSAGERQVALFFDGALLNVPWDNRIDLDLIPIAALGGMVVQQGVSSVAFGPNVLAGAINLVSRSLEKAGRATDLSGQAGSLGFVEGNVTHMSRTERTQVLASVGLSRSEAFTLPSGADLPFSQESSSRRTNTDSRLAHAFARGEYFFGRGSRLAVSLSHIDAEKGIAPEGHLDPSESRVRYWRYPTWRNTMGIANGRFWLGPQWALVTGSMWLSRFEQTIDQYRTSSYQERTEREEDHDVTAGIRMIVNKQLRAGLVRLVSNNVLSRHRQIDTDLPSNMSATGQLTFTQYLWGTGLEYERAVSDQTQVVAGFSVDGLTTPQTGDKPGRAAFRDVSATIDLSHVVSNQSTVRLALGRKTRFPTMRELYGEALGRFKVNPDLESERSYLGELSLGVRSPETLSRLTIYGNLTRNTLDQEVVVEQGQRLRRRINLEGSRVLGVELSGTATLNRPITIDWLAGAAYGRAYDDSTDSYSRRLAERPDASAHLKVTYQMGAGVNARAEASYTGRAYSLDQDNSLVPLDRSLVLNLRMAKKVRPRSWAKGDTEVYLRVNNVTDAVTLPQLGLPGPGRHVRLGFKAGF